MAPPDNLPSFVKNSGWFFVILFTATLAVYWNSFHVRFLLDDTHTIVTNWGLRNISDLTSVFTSNNPGRPFLFLTLALNFAIGGLNPLGYHIVNFALHVATAWLLFLIIADILRREGVSECKLFGAIGALLFALHPLNVETVTYISSRSSGMATFLYLLSFWFAVSSGMRFNARLASALAAFILALFTKEFAVTLPLLLVVFIAQFKGNKELRKSAPALATFWLISPFYFLYRIFALGHPMETKSIAMEKVGGLTYFITQLEVVWLKYVPRLFVPIKQVFDGDNDFKTSFLDAGVMAGAVLLLLAVYYALANFRGKRVFSFSLIWFLLTLSVTSSFYPILDAYVEHRLYIAMPAFCLAVSYAGCLLYTGKAGMRKIVIAMFALVLVIFGSLTYARNNLFGEPLLLWEDTIQKARAKPRIYAGLAYEHLRNGDYDKAEDAIMFGTTAFPDEIDLQLAHCWILGAQKKYGRMEKALAKIKPVYPSHRADYYNYKGLLEGQKGNFDSAMGYFRQSLKLKPGHVDAKANMAVLLNASGRPKKAINLLLDAIKENPYVADFHFQLANLYLAKKPASALREYRRTLEMDPFHAGAKKALALK